MKKIGKFGEAAYILGTAILALGVCLMTKAELGMSMVVAPAYIFSLRFPAFSFGTTEYIFQALLLVAMWIMVRKVNLKFLFSSDSVHRYIL